MNFQNRLFILLEFKSVLSPPRLSRSSRPDVFCKTGIFKNFAKFKRKHLCQSLFFNKAAGLRPAILLKKRLCYIQMFSCEFCEIFKNTYFHRTPLVTANWSKNYISFLFILPFTLLFILKNSFN